MTPYKFGRKHIEYMRRCRECTMNVAEGAVRAGKTVDHVFVFAELLERSPDRIHLATGTTIASAKLNIGDCNGLGLERYFGKRAVWGRYRDNECMRIMTRTGEKIVVFAGGKNSDAYKRIRGNSYGMWIATEINLHHDSMIKEAFNRQLAARDRRVFWDLNPGPPGSSIYRDYIDLYMEKSANGETSENFYNYCHFTIRDNPTVTGERLSEIVSQYDPASVWYRRDILGERCAAEGLVYPYFANNTDSIILSDRELPRDIELINIGVDFGGNRSKTTFVATGFRNDRELFILKDHAVSGGKGEIDSVRVNLELEAFVNSVRSSYGCEVRYIFCDSEAQYLINGLKKHFRRIGDTASVTECRKLRIRDRIDCTCALMASGRFHVAECCELVRHGLAEALWDPDAEGDVRLDNFTSDIDILDAMEYSFERYYRKLV